MAIHRRVKTAVATALSLAAILATQTLPAHASTSVTLNCASQGPQGEYNATAQYAMVASDYRGGPVTFYWHWTNPDATITDSVTPDLFPGNVYVAQDKTSVLPPRNIASVFMSYPTGGGGASCS